MPPLDAASSTAPSTTGLVTVNPYVYLAALTREETYALLAAAACLALAGAILIQREAVAQLFSRFRRR